MRLIWRNPERHLVARSRFSKAPSALRDQTKRRVQIRDIPGPFDTRGSSCRRLEFSRLVHCDRSDQPLRIVLTAYREGPVRYRAEHAWSSTASFDGPGAKCKSLVGRTGNLGKVHANFENLYALQRLRWHEGKMLCGFVELAARPGQRT